MSKPQITTRKLRLEDIKPYPGNPRRIPDEAVQAAARSIEKYGYRQPIVIDEDNVVIVGHTRLKALQHLGYRSATVIVASDLSDEQVREYRLVDNKVGEMTAWDHDSLVAELREITPDVQESFFPDVDLEIGLLEEKDPDFDQAEKNLQPSPSPELTRATSQVTCPACDKEFEVWTKTLPGVTDEILREIENGTSE